MIAIAAIVTLLTIDELLIRCVVWWRVRRETQKPETKERIRRQVEWRMKQRSTREEIQRRVEEKLRNEQ